MSLRNGIRKNVWIEEETLDWISTSYPGLKLTWLINNLLENFKRSHESNNSAMDEHLKSASELTIEDTRYVR